MLTRIMKNKVIITLLLLVGVLALTVEAQKIPIITFEKTPCFGNCPVYKLEIYKNRKMHLSNTKYLKVGEGDFSAKLKRKEYKAILNQFQEINFLQLKDQYITKNVSDLPTRYITLAAQGKTKTVMDYSGAPEQLTKLEDQLQQLIDQTNWKKSN